MKVRTDTGAALWCWSHDKEGGFLSIPIDIDNCDEETRDLWEAGEFTAAAEHFAEMTELTVTAEVVTKVTFEPEEMVDTDESA